MGITLPSDAANKILGILNTWLLMLPNIEIAAPMVNNPNPMGPNIFLATSPNGFSVNDEVMILKHLVKRFEPIHKLVPI